MIEANDGQIRAERPAGGGACFVFDLPIVTGCPTCVGPLPLPSIRHPSYVVDDDPSVRAALEDLLASMACRCTPLHPPRRSLNTTR